MIVFGTAFLMPRCDTASTKRLCSGGVHTKRGRFRACAWSSSEPVEKFGEASVRGLHVEVRQIKKNLCFFADCAPYGTTRDEDILEWEDILFAGARTLESHGHAGLLARSLERLEASGVFHASLVRHHVLVAHVRIQVACGVGGRSAAGQIRLSPPRVRYFFLNDPRRGESGAATAMDRGAIATIGRRIILGLGSGSSTSD